MSATTTITSRGRITLPRDVRKALGSNTVELKVDGETVELMPTRSIAGALGKYAEKKAHFKKVREKVWEAVASGQGEAEGWTAVLL